MNDDKLVERDRYDRRAAAALVLGTGGLGACDGARGVRGILRSPYLAYESALRKLLKADCRALEIGAGSGNFTRVLLETGAQVTATDISFSSLRLLTSRFRESAELTVAVLDMEFLPFESESFDLVAMAGSLSYGDNDLVMREAHRVLRVGGSLVCVDSLNHNPIYRFNRWVQYRRGERSRSTLRRMPTVQLIERYRVAFGAAEVRYFGALSWLMPVVVWVLGEQRGSNISDRFDRLTAAAHSAFKFVMVARKQRGEP